MPNDLPNVTAARQPEPPAAILWRWVAIILAAWGGTTVLNWRGYIGVDDIVYAKYAYELHRMPINWWEFRMPTIMAMRASFALFGPTEFAAALPTLLASLGLLAGAAIMVGWPRQLNWRTNATMLLVACMPLDADMRSIPGAAYLNGALSGLGTALFLRQTPHWRALGALVLAICFIGYEVAVFYVVFVCLAALVVDWRAYWSRVLLCGGLCVAFQTTEMLAYWKLMGDPLARFHVAVSNPGAAIFAYDPDTGISGVRYFTWPLEILFLSKAFGLCLSFPLVGGLLVRTQLPKALQVVWLSSLATWFWYGYGTLSPTKYMTLFRQFHYYGVLVLGIACLTPIVLQWIAAQAWFARWLRPAWRGFAPQSMVGFLLLVNLLLLLLGGRWGQEFDTSREFLSYARQHPEKRFAIDVHSMNILYVENGFRMPENIICLNGPSVQQHLRQNKEPASVPRYVFPEVKIDAVILNRDMEVVRPLDPEILSLAAQHPEVRVAVVPPVEKVAGPVLRLLGLPKLAVKRFGAELIPVSR